MHNQGVAITWDIDLHIFQFMYLCLAYKKEVMLKFISMAANDF